MSARNKHEEMLERDVEVLERTVELLGEAYGRTASCTNCPAAHGCTDGDCSDTIEAYCKATAEHGGEL